RGTVFDSVCSVRGWRELIAARLPNSNTRAVWAVALFVSVQCADAVQTAWGIQRFGPSIEANPLLAIYFGAVGPTVTLFGAKFVALIGALALFGCARYLALVLLTIGVVFSAVLPWAYVLSL